jgi:hypothetical protein
LVRLPAKPLTKVTRSDEATSASSEEAPVYTRRNHQKNLRKATRQLELKIQELEPVLEGQEEEEEEDFTVFAEPDLNFIFDADADFIADVQDIFQKPDRLDVFEKLTLKSSRQTKAAMKSQKRSVAKGE